LDHFGATQDIHEETKAPVMLHKDDTYLWSIADQQAAMLGLPRCRHAEVNNFIDDEEEITFGKFTLQALHTPGHSAGSMCFKIDDGKEQHLFSGDTLFNRGVGRTDLPTGDQGTLVKSIKQRLYTLDSDTKVIPGHGPSTRIGEEKRSNPYVSI
jgi:glyoxylase-like metal-dependent hydrolase (beta-lactamase superfamily II)